MISKEDMDREWRKENKGLDHERTFPNYIQENVWTK